MTIRFIMALICTLPCLAQTNQEQGVPVETYRNMGTLWDLSFSEDELSMMSKNLVRLQEGYKALHAYPLVNSVPPALLFEPLIDGRLPEIEDRKAEFKLPKVKLPKSDEEIAFLSILEQASLLRSGKLSSTKLTKIYLERLKTYGPKLECVISLLEEEALKRAAEMDQEIKKGQFRSLLHGIPYGAKDLFAVKGTKTTWGAAAYKDQVIDETATVISKLDDAGAVLVAKLTLGALAMGDVWYGGTTKNPWNLEVGSSGSSAGSASATAAGLVSFSLGTETSGSIVSPSTRCGVTGLRPTFGRVSRHGAMALSWTMDKAGPIARSAEDTAVVFDVIRGRDYKDLSVRDAPFPYSGSKNWNHLRIGLVSEAFERDYPGKKNDQAVVEVLRKAGAKIDNVTLPKFPVGGMYVILFAESAAAFDALTRSDRDDLLVAQSERSWPNTFRWARTIPAVEYIQANRLRTELIAEMAELFSSYDVLVVPSYGAQVIQTTNLSGHPCVVVPNGFVKDKQMGSISFIGGLYKEHEALKVATAYQNLTGFHTMRPEDYKN